MILHILEKSGSWDLLELAALSCVLVRMLYTVEPRLSGHSWGNGQWPFKGGWLLKRGTKQKTLAT